MGLFFGVLISGCGCLAMMNAIGSGSFRDLCGASVVVNVGSPDGVICSSGNSLIEQVTVFSWSPSQHYNSESNLSN